MYRTDRPMGEEIRLRKTRRAANDTIASRPAVQGRTARANITENRQKCTEIATIIPRAGQPHQWQRPELMGVTGSESPQWGV